MSPISKQWILYANSDLDAAHRLFQSPKPTRWTYLLVLWHCQQAIEKTMKGYIAGQGREVLRIHDLTRLAQLTGLSFTEANMGLFEDLNASYLRSRYPDLPQPPLPNPNRKAAASYLKKSDNICLWLQQQ